MTTSLEFIDCNLEQMRAHWSKHAINVLPYCGWDSYTVAQPNRYLEGKAVLVMQVTRYYNSQNDVVAKVYRPTFYDGTVIDFPFLLRIKNKIYVLTEW